MGRKGRAARRRTGNRIRHEAQKSGSSGDAQTALRSVVDSDEDSTSSLGSAAMDYVQNIQEQAQASQSPGNTGREEVPLEELFPCLAKSGSMTNQPAVDEWLASSSDEDNMAVVSGKDNVSGNVDLLLLEKSVLDAASLRRMSKSVQEQEKLRILSVLKELVAQKPDASQYPETVELSVGASGVDGIVVTIELAQLLLLHADIVRPASGSVFEAGVPSVRLHKFPGVAYKWDDVEAMVSTSLEKAFVQRRPSFSCTLDRPEALVRACAEHVVACCVGKQNTEVAGAVEFTNVMWGNRGMHVVGVLGNIFGFVVAYAPDRSSCTLVLPQTSKALRPLTKSEMAILAECVVRRFCWDDISFLVRNEMPSDVWSLLPASIGSLESNTRAIATHIMRTWSNPILRVPQKVYCFSSHVGQSLLVQSLEALSDIECLPQNDTDIEVKFTSAETPSPETVQVLTGYLEASIRHSGAGNWEASLNDKTAVLSASRDDLDQVSSAPPVFFGDIERRKSKRKGKAGASQKGNSRLITEYMDVVGEVATFLEKSPPSRRSFELPPCRPEFVAMVEKVVEIFGSISILGKDGQQGPSKLDVEQAAMNVFHSFDNRGGGSAKGRRARSKKKKGKGSVEDEAGPRWKRAPPLDASNKGYQLLVGTMGHNMSRGLGVNEQGRVDPVMPEMNQGRRGLGS